MSRKLGDWLSAYLKLCDNTEPPLSYHTWVGISSISATLQRKCHIRWGHETIYPNMYIVLIGPSGRCRKGTAINIGRYIVKKAGVAMTAETLTRERLIRAMSESVASFPDKENKSIIFHCSLYTVSEELSVFLGQSDVRFLADLTDWYDSRSEWRYETKTSGTDNLQNICYSLLGGTAPDWLISILPPEAIGGGFTSRIIFVVEERKRKTVAKPSWTEEEEQLRTNLIHDLQVIKLLTGPFILTPEATEFYENWYNEQDEQVRKGNYAVSDPKFAGYCERRATHIRKLSMVMSASRGNSKVVEKKDFERALLALTAVEKNMGRVFSSLGEARYGKLTQELLDYVQLRGSVTRTELMGIYYKDVDNFVLEVIEKVWETMKAVRIDLVPNKNEKIYTALKKPKYQQLERIDNAEN